MEFNFWDLGWVIITSKRDVEGNVSVNTFQSRGVQPYSSPTCTREDGAEGSWFSSYDKFRIRLGLYYFFSGVLHKFNLLRLGPALEFYILNFSFGFLHFINQEFDIALIHCT